MNDAKSCSLGSDKSGLYLKSEALIKNYIPF